MSSTGNVTRMTNFGPKKKVSKKMIIVCSTMGALSKFLDVLMITARGVK